MAQMATADIAVWLQATYAHVTGRPTYKHLVSVWNTANPQRPTDASTIRTVWIATFGLPKSKVQKAAESKESLERKYAATEMLIDKLTMDLQAAFARRDKLMTQMGYIKPNPARLISDIPDIPFSL